jgi:hypothetical protein
VIAIPFYVVEPTFLYIGLLALMLGLIDTRRVRQPPGLRRSPCPPQKRDLATRLRADWLELAQELVVVCGVAETPSLVPT